MADQERGEPLDHQVTGWDTRQLAVYFEALRKADEKFQAERDRRYTEVKEAEEKALQVEEKARETALRLAAENQKLRDEAHNELLNQWREDRSTFASKDDLSTAVEKVEDLMRPAREWVAGRRGRDAGALDTKTTMLALVGFLLALAAIISPHL